MAFRTFVRFALILVLSIAWVGLHPIYTAASNARIIRLSLVQGDVRVLHDSKGDPLANDRATWDRAELNLPLRQHDVVATDNGRAEVEFENGAMAFLDANTVLEFFDLSFDDGAMTTRLILRQGTASFYANPGNADYFSVTGGDFTAQAGSHANFRMGNFDDGSTIAVTHGRVSVENKSGNTVLAKGQSLNISAGDEKSARIARAPEGDDFDRWVSGREDNVVTATNAAMQYSNSSTYVSGFGDLYTYGGFYPIGGFGYGWQPYGVGLGWSPFDYGSWYFQSGLGWSFIGSQPWGWLPYHYGGWIFQPGVGYLWTPTGFGGSAPVRFHPVTAAFVRSGDTLGLVPTHPLDKGKSTINLAQGVMPLTPRAGTVQTASATSAKWSVLKQPPADALVSHPASTTAPARVARTMNSSDTAARSSAEGGTIVYDAKEQRFVNSNVRASSAAQVTGATTEKGASAELTQRPGANAATSARARTPAPAVENRSTFSRSASSRVAPPPAAPRAASSARAEFPTSASSSSAAIMGTTTRSSASAPAPSAHSSSGSGHPH